MENQNYVDCTRCNHMTVLFGLPFSYCCFDKEVMRHIYLREFEREYGISPEWCPLEKEKYEIDA